MGTLRLGRSPRTLALVSQQVAKRRKFAPVASVVPALRFRSRFEHAHLALGFWGGRRGLVAAGVWRRSHWNPWVGAGCDGIGIRSCHVSLALYESEVKLTGQRKVETHN